MAANDEIEDGFEAIHNRFGLRGANYLVLHRTLMQSMPNDWQARFVQCLRELDEAFSHVEQPEAFEVIAAREVEYDELTPAQRKYLGVKVNRQAIPKYWDKNGNEREGWQRALVPTPDPVPHYNRGRTRIEPAKESK